MRFCVRILWLQTAIWKAFVCSLLTFYTGKFVQQTSNIKLHSLETTSLQNKQTFLHFIKRRIEANVSDTPATERGILQKQRENYICNLETAWLIINLVRLPQILRCIKTYDRNFLITTPGKERSVLFKYICIGLGFQMPGLRDFFRTAIFFKKLKDYYSKFCN